MRLVGALGMLLAGPALAAPDGGEAVVARARAFEAGQLRALAARPVELHTHGFVNDGKTTRVIDSFRRLLYHPDGAVTNQFENGQLDGKPATEAELRKALGAEDKPGEQVERPVVALEPLADDARQDLRGAVVVAAPVGRVPATQIRRRGARGWRGVRGGQDHGQQGGDHGPSLARRYGRGGAIRLDRKSALRSIHPILKWKLAWNSLGAPSSP